MISDTNLRELKGKELAQAKDCVKRVNEKLYNVKSQAGNNKNMTLPIRRTNGIVHVQIAFIVDKNVNIFLQ
jgi:hypothetical protein